MKLIPQSEVDIAALNNINSIDRIDGFIAGVEFAENHIIDQLNLLIQMNEDDFDRGKGKYILQQFIKDRDEKNRS